MRRTALLTLALLAACRSGRESQAADGSQWPDSLELAAREPRDSADSVLLAPRLVAEPTVVVFWLAAADTFPAPDQAAVLDELTLTTDRLAPTLARHGIRLIPTNADTVFLALPNRTRQAILLTGLEYPFGYVLLDPENGERILSGVFGHDELLEEIRVYFDLPDVDSAAFAPPITT
ncbi:MAG: hypothetical protein ACREME_00080 [Gemmatimonadales bacterium]